MRIGVIGPTGMDRVAGNVVDALSRMGHEVTSLGPARDRHRVAAVTRASMTVRELLPRVDELIQAGIAKRALDRECQIVINIDPFLMPSVIMTLKRSGIRVAFWYPDHVANLGRQLMLLAPYDALFFKEPQFVRRLQSSLDLPVHYLPEACNPRWHRPMVPAGTDPYLVVAGHLYPSRLRLLERLMAKGIPLKLYGAGIPRWVGDSPLKEARSSGYVFCADKAKVFRSAAGVLNTMFPAEMEGANGRLFQAAGSGGAVITEFRPVVPDLFAVGEEVLVFRDFDELVAHATALLNEVDLTRRLGDAAARRAHRDHTYELRLETILGKVL